MTRLELTAELAAKGWVMREVTTGSAPILVRGACREDHPADYVHGFVYAESTKEAMAYDADPKGFYNRGELFDN